MLKLLINFISLCFFCLSRFVTKGDKLVLFLDYDGTLAPLAAHPNLTVMEIETERSLKVLARDPTVYLGIISGRSADDARGKVGIENITYAGNHGLEINYWNKKHFLYQLPAEMKSNFEKLVVELEENVSIFEMIHSKSNLFYIFFVNIANSLVSKQWSMD